MKEDDEMEINDEETIDVIPDYISEDNKSQLIELAHQSINSKWSSDEIPIPEDNPFSNLNRGVFVTLESNGELRGCMGSIHPYSDVITEVIDLAQTAAFRDPRFQPLTQDEFASIDIEISILSPLTSMNGPEDFTLGVDGVVIEYKGNTGILLPQVVENNEEWTRDKFLSIVSQKADLGYDGWKRYPVKLKKFRCEILK